MTLADAYARLRPGRRIHGISAVLLPYTADGRIDWASFERHLLRTTAAGLDVAVNMDTGFVDLLSVSERQQVLEVTRATLGRGTRFYAGAFPEPVANDVSAAYEHALAAIVRCEAIPVIIQSAAMHAMPPAEKATCYLRLCAAGVEHAVAFELGPVFAPHGEIWDDETFARVVEIPQILGLKHSSLDRNIELRRLAARDRLRPDFRIYTGNDLAIDMVAYGSDYLLGLSTCAPEAFAARDQAFANTDAAFLALNDALQHLGNVVFRAPVPEYKHSAAQYLQVTGHLADANVHAQAPRRADSELALLQDCAERVERALHAARIPQTSVR